MPDHLLSLPAYLPPSIYPDLHVFSLLLAVIYTHFSPSMVPTQYIPLKSLIPLQSLLLGFTPTTCFRPLKFLPKYLPSLLCFLISVYAS